MYNPQLETFLQVADAGSFNKAAEALFISPPAVIKQINLLETQLKVLLFERSHRGLKLTEAGKSLYRDVKYIIAYCNDSVARAQNAMKNSDSVIRIGTSPMTPAQSLIDLWPKVQKQCPGMRFQIIPFENTPENAREILKNLGKNIDVIAGIFDEGMLKYRQCAGKELRQEPICCAVSIQHPLADKDVLTVSDLYGENLLLMHRGWSSQVDNLRDELIAYHPEVNIVDFHFYNLEIFNHCENSRDILMVVPCWKPVHPLLKVIPVQWEYHLPFGFLHAYEPSEAVQRFLEAVSVVE